MLKGLEIGASLRYDNYSDFGNSNVQTIYAIADGAPQVNARNSLVKQTYVRGATPAQDTLTNNSVTWSTQRGWYIDLPAGEQINTTVNNPAEARGPADPVTRQASVSNSILLAGTQPSMPVALRQWAQGRARCATSPENQSGSRRKLAA